MKVIGVIPARGGSKGIPYKNIHLLNGKPLISYTITEALRSKLDKVIVSTDDDEIEKISKSYGAEVMKRPKSLSLDVTPTLPVIQNVLSQIHGDYDAVMTLQPTSPLRTHVHISEAILLLEKNKDADCLVSITKTPHNVHPYSQMVINADGYLNDFVEQKTRILRRQELPNCFARNGAAIYLTRINKINEYIFGGKILPYEMKKEESIDIDDLIDFKIAECLMKLSKYEYL